MALSIVGVATSVKRLSSMSMVAEAVLNPLRDPCNGEAHHSNLEGTIRKPDLLLQGLRILQIYESGIFHKDLYRE